MFLGYYKQLILRSYSYVCAEIVIEICHHLSLFLIDFTTLAQ